MGQRMHQLHPHHSRDADYTAGKDSYFLCRQWQRELLLCWSLPVMVKPRPRDGVYSNKRMLLLLKQWECYQGSHKKLAWIGKKAAQFTAKVNRRWSNLKLLPGLLVSTLMHTIYGSPTAFSFEDYSVNTAPLCTMFISRSKNQWLNQWPNTPCVRYLMLLLTLRKHKGEESHRTVNKKKSLWS